MPSIYGTLAAAGQNFVGPQLESTECRQILALAGIQCSPSFHGVHGYQLMRKMIMKESVIFNVHERVAH